MRKTNPNKLKTGTTDTKDNYPEFRPFSMYALLTCGLILAVAGLYLTLSQQPLVGTTLPSRFGTGGGRKIALSGPGILVIGIIFCTFPAIALIRRHKK